MKKVLTLLLAAALVCSLGACAARLQEEKIDRTEKTDKAQEPAPEKTEEQEQTQEPEKTEPEKTEPETQEPEKSAEPEPGFLPEEDDGPLPTGIESQEAEREVQLQYLAEHVDEWVIEDAEYGFCMYAVTDLDQNGRLELVSSMMAGTGFFSTNRFYELNETADGLTVCEDEWAETGSQPDIMNEEMDFYLRDGVYEYVVSDYLRNGYAENFTVYHALSLSDGVIRMRYLESQTNEANLAYQPAEGEEYDEEKAFTITYEDDSGEITKEQFEDIDRFFLDSTKGKVTLGWFELTEDADVAALLAESAEKWSRT